MEKKNTKLFIIVGVLLVSIGVSLAYFVSSTVIKGSGALVDVTASEINGAEVKVEGVLNFDDANICPGHKNIASVKLTATGDNELIPYNLIWSGTNTINTPLNYTVYKTNDELSVASTCNKKTEVINGMQALSEECTISNMEALGTSISSGTINKGDTKVTLVSDEFITAYSTSNKVYYYIILEYPNLDKEQNEDINGILNGKIKAEESSTKPDINILAAYIEQDNGEYQQVDDIPQSGYVINTSKSTCSNGAIPSWKDNGLFVSSLTKSGTSCYLYFDKYVPTASDIILSNLGENIKSTTPDFSKIADTDEGVYATGDGMYGGTTYYWRGAATTNHVIFAEKCWRIVRINGDKTIRLIYNGSIQANNTCTGNGTNNGNVIFLDVTSVSDYSQPNLNRYATTDYVSNNPSYVGWTYQLSIQRPTSTATETSSNAKTQTEKWYSNTSKGNLKVYEDKIADGKFCNDREIGSGSWNTGGSNFYYAGYTRLSTNNSPTFNCPSGDVYTLKIGAITADEVEFAGGTYEGGNTNDQYYLYTGKGYWTITPYFWFGRNVVVFCVNHVGQLTSTSVNVSSLGLRPVMNLKSDVTFSSGNGEQSTPYIVTN